MKKKKITEVPEDVLRAMVLSRTITSEINERTYNKYIKDAKKI